jgi:Ser-tRNA(Ala) deacylase AlaX
MTQACRGQPSDVGKIGAAQVTAVKEGENGEIVHSVDRQHLFELGERVQLEIDETQRRLFARLHSAGHLLDSAMERLNLSSELKPGKGYHFPNAPFVEYVGILNSDEKSSLMEKLQTEIDILCEQQREMETDVGMVEFDRIEQVLGEIPSYLPQGRAVRVVSIAGKACACGGTHVKRIAEIDRVIIRKILTRKNTVQVKYAVQ